MSSTNGGPSVTTTPNVVVQAVPAGSSSVPFDPSSVAITGGTIANAPVGRIPYVLAQTGVPTILPSSGSSNATGQITLTTALPYQPVGTVQVYLPAGVVVGDGAGGLKSVTFSSTTVCQIVGSPATANAAYTQTTAQITLSSVVVPAGVLGLNGALRVEPQFGIPNNANSKTFYLMFGGQQAAGWSDATATYEVRGIRIRNRGAQNSQVTTNWAGYSTGTGAVPYLSVDTSLQQTLAVQAQLAVATDFIILDALAVEVLPAG